MFKINSELLRKYRGGRYSGKITLFLPEPGNGQSAPDEKRSVTDWQQWATGGVETIQSPGNHFTMVREPHARVLAEKLQALLKAPQPEGTP